MKAISHTSHHVWIQGWDNLPDHLHALVDRFYELHPDWDHQVWDHERIMDDLDLRAAATVYEHAEQHVPAHAVNQLRADIARYAILHKHGGVTLDVDYAWRGPIDPVIKGRNVVLCYEIDGSWIANGFMAANPKHTLFTRILDGIPEQAARLDGAGLSANTYTGPKYLTRIVSDLGPRKDLRILPAKTFHPVPWNKAEQADHVERYTDSIAVHQWNHRRQLDGSWPRTWAQVA